MADVVTGEAVVLDVRTARLPTRVLGLAFDVFLVQVPLLVLTTYLAGRIGNIVDSAATQAISLVLFVLIIVGYPVTVESLWRGRTLGKAVAGLRVVGDDGSPERFRQALFRGLAGFVEIWITFGIVALFTSLLSRHGRRLGDIFAGTVAVRERMPARGGPVPAMPPHLAGWAAGLELSALPGDLALHARQFLSRYDQLAPQARDAMARQLASAVAERVSPAPPPGISAPEFLATVLAERRRREGHRLGASQPYAQAPYAPIEGHTAVPVHQPPRPGAAPGTQPQGYATPPGTQPPETPVAPGETAYAPPKRPYTQAPGQPYSAASPPGYDPSPGTEDTQEDPEWHGRGPSSGGFVPPS